MVIDVNFWTLTIKINLKEDVKLGGNFRWLTLFKIVLMGFDEG